MKGNLSKEHTQRATKYEKMLFINQLSGKCKSKLQVIIIASYSTE